MNKQEINEFAARISQSNRTGIVVTTYEIILNYLDSGKKCLDNRDETEFVFNMKKARQFLHQLSTALDFRYEISRELMSLYLYANDCLLKSELRREDVHLDTVRTMMEKLKTAFEKVSEIDSDYPAMTGAGKIYEGLTYGRNAKGTIMVSK